MKTILLLLITQSLFSQTFMIQNNRDCKVKITVQRCDTEFDTEMEPQSFMNFALKDGCPPIITIYDSEENCGCRTSSELMGEKESKIYKMGLNWKSYLTLPSSTYFIIRKPYCRV